MVTGCTVFSMPWARTALRRDAASIASGAGRRPKALKTRPSGSTRARHKAAMVYPGKLERKTKEVIALAVSAANSCEHCIKAHAAALKQMGFDDEAVTELMAFVDQFNGFSRLLEGLRVESNLTP